MDALVGEVLGSIQIIVCKSQEGKTFFFAEGSNKNVLPILDYVENSLEKKLKID